MTRRTSPAVAPRGPTSSASPDAPPVVPPRPGRAPRRLLAGLLAGALLAAPALASGTLTPVGSAAEPMQLLDHRVSVRVQDGFARTEVFQTFFNPGAVDAEAIYEFPVPAHGCLSEMAILVGEEEILGEVVDEETADRVYESEKDDGNDAGKGAKTEWDDFRFWVSRVPAGGEASFRFVYYQRLELDAGVGRYVYPLEDGGTEEAARSFWTSDPRVRRSFSFDVTLASSWPVDQVRIPGYEGATVVDRQGPGEYTARLELVDATLERDLVFYYRLQPELPGRIEVVPYRADPGEPGTFMMVVTPGVDLHPITTGSDYVFVLDVSGSMSSKLSSMVDAVSRAIGELSPEDRFRIILFGDRARDVLGGFVAADEFTVDGVRAELAKMGTGGGTNLYAGLSKALSVLDADRATSVLLVTDGVTNQGVVDPKRFSDLMAQHDVRVFGFLMGNNANWPLMRLVCDASGGFYQSVSTSDDLLGQVLLAKGKVTHECLHDASLSVTGVDVFDTTVEHGPKVYLGQQLVVFGRYREGGTARVELQARLTGIDRTYTTEFEFPAIDTEVPELERLWAMSRIEQVEREAMLGLMPPEECADAVESYGVDYQLVTDETSMLVLDDAAFAKHGIERRNKERVAVERSAQTVRAGKPPTSRRVDRHAPAFPGNAPSPGGGGAVDPTTVLAALALAALAIGARR